MRVLGWMLALVGGVGIVSVLAGCGDINGDHASPLAIFAGQLAEGSVGASEMKAKAPVAMEKGLRSVGEDPEQPVPRRVAAQSLVPAGGVRMAVPGRVPVVETPY